MSQREIPILFNGDMVQAILDGRKTQTRRPMKEQPPDGTKRVVYNPSDFEPDRGWYFAPHGGRASSPFGAPGDLLYVRECWGIACSTGREDLLLRLPLHEYERLDDYGEHDCMAPGYHIVYRATHHEEISKGWRRSIHMPKWAARIRLRVKRVWVKQVQAISDADVCAEGVEQIHINKNRDYFHPNDVHGIAFGELWDTIYAEKFPWSGNPWVFGCEFERIER